MEILTELSNKRLRNTTLDFSRFLINTIDWNDRLISIVGARGSGKTTLLLQRLKIAYKASEAMYVSLDNIYFSNHRLVEIADRFVKLGGKALFLDEAHKYPTWSVELKNIYDEYPELHVVFSGSSMLELIKGQGDLSRRLSVYRMPVLSFREYIAFEHNIVFPVYSLSDILASHVDIASTINEKIKPVALFEAYLKHGALPFFKESISKYHERLMNTVNTVLESDLPTITTTDYAHVLKIKMLLKIISESVPFKPNITKLASNMEINRKSVLKYLDILKKAELILLLKSSAGGDTILTKPQKVYLGNPNLMFALCDEKPNYGTLRETFFLNQLSTLHEVAESPVSDFIVNNIHTFEVGGKKKKEKQLADVSDSYVAADNLEYGFGRHIPLWMFGFLY